MADETDFDAAGAAGSLRPADIALGDLTRHAEAFGAAIASAFKMAASGARDFEGIVQTLALRLAGTAFDRAFAPIGDLLAGKVAGAPGPIPVAGSRGAAGAAPEAAAATTVHFNITTPDADSFRKSEAQVTSMLARAVGRGRRGL